MKNLRKLVSSALHNQLVERALHTFIQAFVAAWLVTGLRFDKVSLLAATAAAISAVKTLLVARYKQ